MAPFQQADSNTRQHGAKIVRQSIWNSVSQRGDLAHACAAASRHPSEAHDEQRKANPTGTALTPGQALSVFGHYAEPDVKAPAKESVSSARFTPPTGTKDTILSGRYGRFKITHGLTRLPDDEQYGSYSMRIEMIPNQAVGKSNIGFIQVFRVGRSANDWATQHGDLLTEGEAARVTKSGHAVDRGNAKRDKTPFYGMVREPNGELRQRYPVRIGRFGGSNAILQDTPGVLDPYKIEFSATAIDMNNGARFGSVAWGFEFDSDRKISLEETPRLVEDGSERAQGRDEAVEKWNQVVAGKDGIEKIPGVWR